MKLFWSIVATLLVVNAEAMLLQKQNGCTTCHDGIAPIRAIQSGMMQEILRVAKKANVAGNDCVVCHGGNPQAKNRRNAHQGTLRYFASHEGPKAFYPAPASTWVNRDTCGMCHKEQVSAQMNSLMMSEQGKIQGTLYSFGMGRNNIHDIANYAAKNPGNLHQRLGTAAYQEYMSALQQLEPQVYVKKTTPLRAAPTAQEVDENVSLAAITYLRQECLRCHTGSKGRSRYGDYRGIGCASCHIPYANSGLYAGHDKQIKKDKPGHLLVHSIQSSRDTNVTVGAHHYSGVPVETCTTCHNRGKRIGVSYQGLMESAYGAPYHADGSTQQPLHTKRYLHLKSDVHFQKGMLCQDCHTSNDLHGDGFLSGTTLAPVEIECQDCHGTTKSYPWELPLGYSDEFNRSLSTRARGVTMSVAKYLKQGSVEEAKEGYLRSARGNALIHSQKQGNAVIFHLASGKDVVLKPLKLLKSEGKLSLSALAAMDSIEAHTDKLECYSCHAQWAPQCYGCHVKIDYSKGKKHVDWLAAATDHDIYGRTGGMRNLKAYLIDGEVSETRSYLRWEDPPLSINGEGRVSPTIPGCQTTITVIGSKGQTLLHNKIFTIAGAEGSGKKGMKAIDMSPVQPHTISKESRSCESCHNSAKALGLGITGVTDLSKGYDVEIASAAHAVLTQNAKKQIAPIAAMNIDYSQFVDANGTQLQTVGHHFKLSRALNMSEMQKIDRRGVCLSCHETIPEGDLAVSMMVHIAQVANISVDKKEHGAILNKLLRLSAWVQLLAIVALVVSVIYFMFFRKKRLSDWS